MENGLKGGWVGILLYNGRNIFFAGNVGIAEIGTSEDSVSEE